MDRLKNKLSDMGYGVPDLLLPIPLPAPGTGNTESTVCITRAANTESS